MTDDRTDPKTIAKGKKAVALRRQGELEDIAKVLSTLEGRRVLWRIMDHTNFLAANMFTGNSTTFFNLGKREEGLWLYNEIMESDPKAFLTMMQLQLPQEDENNG